MRDSVTGLPERRRCAGELMRAATA